MPEKFFPQKSRNSFYGQLHGHSEREIALASAELRAQNQKSHVRTPIDAKRLADFLVKIEAHEAVLLQRQRDTENQIVVYHIFVPLPERRCWPNGGPMLSMMTVWEWDSPRETTKNLTRPEVARYVIQMTKDLADLLGIPLEEITRHG